MPRSRPPAALVAVAVLAAWALPVRAQPGPARVEPLPAPRALRDDPGPPIARPPQPARPIDLATALKLAGVDNPEILRARERVVEAVARRQLAAAQLLPTLNAGGNLNSHQGTPQSSSGEVLKLNRESLYLGLGANAVGAGTVAIPGVVWNASVSEAYFRTLGARQEVRRRAFEGEAVRNDVLLRVAAAYLELLRATGRRAIARGLRADAAEVARVTANFAKAGQGRQADADRAAAELRAREVR